MEVELYINDCVDDWTVEGTTDNDCVDDWTVDFIEDKSFINGSVDDWTVFEAFSY